MAMVGAASNADAADGSELQARIADLDTELTDFGKTDLTHWRKTVARWRGLANDFFAPYPDDTEVRTRLTGLTRELFVIIRDNPYGLSPSELATLQSAHQAAERIPLGIDLTDAGIYIQDKCDF